MPKLPEPMVGGKKIAEWTEAQDLADEVYPGYDWHIEHREDGILFLVYDSFADKTLWKLYPEVTVKAVIRKHDFNNIISLFCANLLGRTMVYGDDFRNRGKA